MSKYKSITSLQRGNAPTQKILHQETDVNLSLYKRGELLPPQKPKRGPRGEATGNHGKENVSRELIANQPQKMRRATETRGKTLQLRNDHRPPSQSGPGRSSTCKGHEHQTNREPPEGSKMQGNKIAHLPQRKHRENEVQPANSLQENILPKKGSNHVKCQQT